MLQLLFDINLAFNEGQMHSLDFSKTQNNLFGAVFLIIVKLCFTDSFSQLQQIATGNFYNEK